MKAEELRIGNWVQFDNCQPAQMALADFSDWYNDHNSHIFGDYIHPIPLTEEWLLRFRFEKIPKKDELMQLRYIRYLNYETAEEVRKWDNEDGFCFNLDETRDIELFHVHQLQNLYFALTGEELQ